MPLVSMDHRVKPGGDEENQQNSGAKTAPREWISFLHPPLEGEGRAEGAGWGE
jgi:hypothetical protein